MYKLHINSWSRCRSFIRSVWCLIVYSKVVHIFRFTSSAISSVLHSISKRRWATWYTFLKNMQRLPVFVGFVGTAVVSRSAVESIICCFADPGDTTVKPPPLKSFWGLAAVKRDWPGRMGEPEIQNYSYPFFFIYLLDLILTYRNTYIPPAKNVKNCKKTFHF